MNKVALLLKSQMYNTFAINEMFDEKSKNKNHTFLMGVTAILLIGFFAVYNVMTALTLVSVSEQSLIPTYMVGVSSFTILGFTLLWSNGILFGAKDYDMLSSLPVSSKEIIGSKFTFMYLISFLLCFLFMIPAGIVWLINTEGTLLYFLMYFVSTFFVPLIPMCIASLVGIIIMWGASKFAYKNIFSLIFSLLALGFLLLIGIYSMETGTDNNSIGVILAKQISRLYPPSLLFDYQDDFAFIQNGIFVFVSVVTFLIFHTISSKYYMKINVMMKKSAKTSHGNVKWNQHTPFVAMYKKEYQRFFSSYLCMLNLGLGILSLLLVSLLLCIVPLDVLGKYAGVTDVSGFFAQYAPLIIVAMLSISCTTSSSISLEGENLWILQSVPLAKKSFLGAKVVYNMSLHAIAYLVAIIVFVFKFGFAPMQILTMLCVAVSYSIFISVQGLFFNATFPKYNWDNEVVVIKQSMSVIISGLFGMIFVAIPALLHWFLSLPLDTFLWGMVIVLNIISAILYQKTYSKKII